MMVYSDSVQKGVVWTVGMGMGQQICILYQQKIIDQKTLPMQLYELHSPQQGLRTACPRGQAFDRHCRARGSREHVAV